LCFADASSTETADSTGVNKASVVQEQIGPKVALLDMMEDDSILTQFLTDSGTAVTNVECLPLNFLDDVVEVTEEIGLNGSNSSDLPVSLESVGSDGYEHAVTDSPVQLQGSLLSSLSSSCQVFMSTSEAENRRQTESSICCDALDDVNDEDLITVGTKDVSQTKEMIVDGGTEYMYAPNNNTGVKFSDSEVLSSSSQGAPSATVSVSLSYSEQNFEQDVTNVTDVNRSAKSREHEVFMSTSEAEDRQLSSVCHDDLDAVNTEDLITAVGNDVSQTKEMTLDGGTEYTCAQDNNTDSEMLSSSSQGAPSATVSVSQSYSEQNFEQDVTNVTDVDRSAKSPEHEVFMSTSEAEKRQLSSVCHDDLDAVNTEDLITAVGNDVSQTKDMTLDGGTEYTCAQDNNMDSEMLSSSSQGAPSATVSVSQSYSEQNFEQDVTNVTDVDRSAKSREHGVFISTSEAEDRQLSESPVCHDAIGDVNAEDLRTAIINDVSHSTEMTLDECTCAPIDNTTVKFSDSEVLSSSSQGAPSATGSVSQSYSEQHFQQDVTDVTDVDRSAKSPEPMNYTDVVQMDTQGEQQASTSLSPAASSMTDGDITCMTDCNVNSDELIDDVHSSSLLVYSSSNAENVGTQLELDQELLKPDNGGDAAVACNMKESLSEESCNILPTNDILDSMEVDVDDIHLELSCVTDTVPVVDTAGSTSLGYMSQLAVQDECAVESVKLSRDTIECTNAAVSASDAASIQKHTTVSDQSLELICEEMPETTATETDTASEGDANDGNDVANSSRGTGSEVKVVSSTSGNSYKQDRISLSDSARTPGTNRASTEVLVSRVSSTVTNHVPQTVEVESHKETDSPSCVIVVKNSSTLPQPSSNVSISHSSSPVLSHLYQHTLSTASSVVSNSTVGIHQLPQSVIPSVMELKSTSTYKYRPAAAIVRDIGKNLVTEFVFQEIIAHEDKWKSASDMAKV